MPYCPQEGEAEGWLRGLCRSAGGGACNLPLQVDPADTAPALPPGHRLAPRRGDRKTRTWLGCADTAPRGTEGTACFHGAGWQLPFLLGQAEASRGGSWEFFPW